MAYVVLIQFISFPIKMINFNIVFLLFVISVMQLVKNALAMNIESIVGGYAAHVSQFTHQVAIVTKKNHTDFVDLACSGSFISKIFILSAAQCFINEEGCLKKYQYSVITDTTYWKFPVGIPALIDLIYLPRGGNYSLDNIAVVKLHDDFNIIDNPDLKALNVPHQNESFYTKIGIVIGYGSLLPSYIHKNDLLQEILKEVDGFLTYANVLIINNTLCVPGNEHINPDKQFCGLMLSKNAEQRWGICEKDIGSPLVFGNKIVGIAGKNHKNCDDTVLGVAYTKVSTYAPFINSIVDGNPLSGTVIHGNREHFSQMVSAAA